ncbi:MAG: hypothetical protein DRO96_02080 [Candidatus Aenigmatarchaeota archaeon]|nr:MAG: hypothetical protein B6U68_01310 [Candidatus Aenigmarchaeota archaeon ex4484_14]RLI96885.1 MAG: hypothetical protein DRO96_02080 [Candidatus Aenigmarchaeota archaeon]
MTGKLIYIRIDRTTLRIKDCRGFASIKGLMFDSMKDFDGALIYGNAVWMPFVKHDLDLFFLDKNMNVLSTAHAKPATFNPATWRIYQDKRAKYCLEIRSGLITWKELRKIKTIEFL